MRIRLRPGDWAWIAITLYEVACPKNEMLSEAMDRYLVRHPRMRRIPLVEAFAFYTCFHCINRLPPRYDLFYWAAKTIRRA